MSRRMGFVPLPLAVLLIRVVTQSLRLNSALSYVILLVLYLWSVVMLLQCYFNLIVMNWMFNSPVQYI